MIRLFDHLLRKACLPGLLHVVCAAVLASGLLPFAAVSAEIRNTASAAFTSAGGVPTVLNSNTTSLLTVPPPSPSVATFYQYAPGVAGAVALAFDGGQFDDTGAGGFQPLPSPLDLDGNSLNLTAPVPVRPTRVFHAGEPVFITLADSNRNVDPSVRETVVVRLTTSTGDSEILILQETGSDTGLFSAVIQSASPAAPLSTLDGRLSVAPNSTITVDYQDTFYPADTSASEVLVDPFGVVFDSVTGQPVDGVTVTMMDTVTGLPATVFGDDGVSRFPATLVTGGSAVDSSGVVYNLPPGGFRFPFVRPGSYRFVVTPVTGYVAPSTVTPANLPAGPSGAYAIVAGSYSDVFVVAPGPALNIDIPVDPLAPGLVMQKAVSQAEASAGDFLQYRLTVQNTDAAVTANAVTVSDRLPFGMKFQPGSLRLNGVAQSDPAIAGDGRTLSIVVGSIAPSASVQISYVVILGAGIATGDAVNSAQASGNAGGMVSNVARVAVRIREPLFSGRFTIIGRVFEGECDTPWDQLKGVANARVMLEDGSYVVTDADGQYHFEGVRPGTHVVQVDVDSLPQGLEPVSCLQNTRFAGRNFSQFVDVKGGGLWRADFHTRVRAADVGIRLNSRMTLVAPEAGQRPVVKGMTHRIEVDGAVPVDKLKVMSMLPTGTSYLPGSGRLDGQPLADPYVAGGVATFELGRVGQAGWQKVIEFATRPEVRFSEPVDEPTSTHTLHARFDSCRAEVSPAVRAEIDRLVRELGDQDISAIELVGHTDNQRLSLRCQQTFKDNHALSQARAESVGAALATGLGLRPSQVTATGRGPDMPVASNNTLAGMAKNRRTEVIVHHRRRQQMPVALPAFCPEQPYVTRAVARFDAAPAVNAQTPPAISQLACPVPDGARVMTPASSEEIAAEAHSEHARVSVSGVARATLPADLQGRQQERLAIREDADASGASDDWFAERGSAPAWLFPTADHNPRSPAVRVVIRHAPGQRVVLRNARGEEISALNFDGVKFSPDRLVAVSIWRGVPLEEGANHFDAEIISADGSSVTHLRQAVHYANAPVRAELVSSQSILLADGINRPVIAVRLLDRDGRPVRAGVTGPVELNAPYVSWEQVRREQERQLAGLERFQPHYVVEGDNGIAYIELAPTTESGAVVLSFTFQTGNTASRRQEIRSWLEPRARDWVVVGFAEGTLGYNTLKNNVQPLIDEGVEEGAWSEGQVSLYAKGRVLGKWLLTMAYDTDKERDRQSLLSTIDPDEFYTLYGDGTEQRHDAPSQAKLYLKLERGQFYALFGDYDTGLSQTQLSRYSRTLNGIKAENAGGPLTFIVFAAETPQNFARDEIQGNGTSGLYKLSRPGIVLNSEQIRIETRDRLQSQNILQSRTLMRHIDYDIDYRAGTLFFRQPVNSRDAGFNPTFIVAEYETLGVADEHLNAGGRVAMTMADEKVVVGVSGIRDENNLGATDLYGTDLKVRLATDTELRVEAAASAGEQGLLSPEGDAWLAELEHHSGKVDALLYARRQDSRFGLNQQNGAESGQQKVGVDGQYRLDSNWSLQGQLYNQENLETADERDAVIGKLQYQTDRGGVGVGAQTITDTAGSGLLKGESFRSDQATATANRFFFNRKLELSVQAETALGGDTESIDFPDRYTLGAGYAITDSARLLIGQEFTEGGAFDTSTTRAGLQVVPWKGARLDSTLNQSRMSENGPRTFGQFGLTQSVLLNDQWGLDVSVDSSTTFNESTRVAPVINPAHPVAPGGTLSSGTLTEDYQALSAGATYREALWSWNGRLEARDGETSDRYGMVTHFLRQAQAGVAFASSAELFRTEEASGTQGLLASLDLSWAWRPLGVQWSVLDRLEFRFEDVENGSGVAGSGLFGNTGLVASNASTRRIINNFALNRVSREWTGNDRQGNLFRRYERNQWSLYYGAKYALDTFDGEDYSGFTDLLGIEVRHDVRDWLDVGVQASSLNAWSAGTHAYSVGPMVGFSPVTNGWITLGYNVRGFTDPDFDAARYTAAGPYLQLRFKFDQNSFRRNGAAADSDAMTKAP